MKRNIMRIELTGPAKARLGKLSEQMGMTQVSMMSRLVEWFAATSPELRMNLMDQVPGSIRADVARLILKRIAEE